MKRQIGATIAVLFLAAAGLMAQGDRGLITGTVKDASGAVVPGAQVTATHQATNTNFQTNTTASGDFTIPSLPVGEYHVRVENTGFKTHIASDIIVAAGATVRLDVALEVGATQQTVEVTANAAMVQTETGRVTTEVSNRLVNELPLIVNGAVRSPFDLAYTTPEVSGSGDALRVGGGRAGGFGMTLDGTAVTVGRPDAQVTWSAFNSPSVDALTEFSVEAAGFKAETGHASGGTISFVSKSGTNELHGNAYEFLRNEALDARGFFAAQKAVYKQHDFGATVGGPVYIPKVYDGRNKTFFFFSYEGFRNRVGARATPYTVPPPEFFTGDLHNWVDRNNKMIQVYDPNTTTLVGNAYTRTPYPNNQIPQSQFDPVAKPIMAYAQPLVKPNLPGLVPGTSAYVRNNAISYGTNQYPQNKYSIKADQVITSNQKVAFLFGRTREQDLGGGNATPTLPIPLSGNPGYNRSDIYRLSYDYTISPTLLNRFYAGGNNWRQNHGAYSTFKDAPQSDGIPTQATGWKEKGICIPNFPDCNMNFPIITMDNQTTWGAGAPNGSDNIVVEFRDDMSKVYGAHTFKWGYYYNNTHYNGFGLTYIAGQAYFSYLNTAFPLDTTQNTGSSFASFLLGQASGYRLDTNRYIAGMYRTHQMYFQDDWRVTKRLTLNLGIRYEFNLAPIYGEDIISNFDPTVPNPDADGRKGGLVFGGSGPGRVGSRSLAPDWFGGIGPRLGFAYALDSKTVIRGAATRSYGPVINPLGSTHYSGFVQQITNTVDPSLGLTPMFTLQGGAPYWAPVPNLIPGVANGSNVPYYNGETATRGSGELTYAFNIQRQLGGDMVAEIGYLGTLASDIQSSLLAYNQLQYRSLPPNLSPFTAAGRTLLTSRIDSPAAVAAGITAPFSQFNKLWGTGNTVVQALKPYPQYSSIDTIAGGGDRLGHSTYHSMQLKLSRRYSAGLTLQASYVLSKWLTDSDNYNGTPTSMDAYNLRLEKSIAASDQTHQVKLTYVYELPFGKGKKFLNAGGVASALAGGWRVAGIQTYASGTPISVGTTINFPGTNNWNRATVPTYDGWRAPTKGGSFDPNVDSFLQPVSFFGPQPNTGFGNETRYNPKLRDFPRYNENISLARTIRLHGEQKRIDFRWDAFNPFNRTRFGALGSATTLQNNNWGLWRTQANTWRQMQLSLKLYW